MPVNSSSMLDHLRREHRNMLALAQRFGTARQLNEFETILHHFSSMDPEGLEPFIPRLLQKVEEIKYDAVREAQDRPGMSVSYRDLGSFYPGLAVAVDEEAMRVRTVLAEVQTYEAAYMVGPTRPTVVMEAPASLPKPSREILKREAVELPTVADVWADLAMEAERLLGYGVMRRRMKLPSPLLAVLAKLEIETLDPASVDLYKKEMLAYAQCEAQRMDIAEGIPQGSYNARVAQWTLQRIESYGKPIPEFALEKAVQIKRGYPAAQFYIEELTIVPDPFLFVHLDNTRVYIDVWDEPTFEKIGDPASLPAI